MTFDPNSLLTEKELIEPRTPVALARWVKDKCRLFADCPEAREWVLLRQGLSKNFHEEAYPLSLVATHLYGERDDIMCIPNTDNRDFDAVVRDYSVSPPSELKVEITSAVDGYDQCLRMERFMKHGDVSLYGKLSVVGTKRTGHKIDVEEEAIEHNDHLKATFSLISSSIERKSTRSNRCQKYGLGHVLVVAFDDWQWFNSERDMKPLEDFVEKDVLRLHLNFAALYVVGLSGKTFRKFEPLKIHDSPTEHQPAQ